MLGNLHQDARYGFRSVRKHPGFTSIITLVLMLGIGTSTTMFSLVRAVLLRPLPFREQERLVLMWKRDATSSNDFIELSYAEFMDWRQQSDVFEALAVMPTTVYGYSYILTGHGEPAQVESTKVSGNFFTTLGLAAAAGRTLLPSDDEETSEQVVVLSDRFWRRQFASDRGVVGRKLSLSGTAYTVIGIMPPESEFPRGADVWVALGRSLPPEAMSDRSVVYLQAVGRLKSGVSIEQARAQLDTVVRHLAEQFPETAAERQSVVITPLEESLVGNVRPALVLLLAASSLLLLIGCVNIANLLLARSTARRREMAIRAALGASGRRIISQLITESVVLSIVGAVFGLALAIAAIKFLAVVLPTDMPRVEDVTVDVWVLGFALLVSLLTGLFFGLAPAAQSAHANLAGTLKAEGGRVVGARGGRRLREVLVVFEVAITLFVLICAGLIVKSFYNLQRVPLGFDPANVLTVQINLPWGKYSLRKQMAFYQQLIPRVEAVPGVKAAGAVLIRPLEGVIGWDVHVLAEGQPEERGRMNPPSNYQVVTPHYFRAVGLSMLEGREFTDHDDKDLEKVVIISDSLAKSLWPDRSPVGKSLKFNESGMDASWRTVVGVVDEASYRGLMNKKHDLYVPYLQATEPIRYLAVRTSGDPYQVLPAIRQEVLALDPDQPIASPVSLKDMVSRSMERERLTMQAMVLFATLSSILASVGIYGVISYSVAQRTREIGIRKALGAQRRHILRMVMGEGLKLTSFGICLGVIGAVATTRLLSSMLVGISAVDSFVYVSVALLLVLLALWASFIPAQRAMRIDPLKTLREE
jgi:predicted permease